MSSSLSNDQVSEYSQAILVPVYLGLVWDIFRPAVGLVGEGSSTDSSVNRNKKKKIAKVNDASNSNACFSSGSDGEEVCLKNCLENCDTMDF